MQMQQLREYLGIALDIEKDIFMQERTIQALSTELAALGRPRPLVKPPVPAKPIVSGNPPARPGVFPSLFAFFVGLALLFAGFYIIHLHDGIRSLSMGATFLPLLLIPVGGILAFKGLGSLLDSSSKYKQAEADYHRQSSDALARYDGDLARYNSDLARYNSDFANDNARLEKEKVRGACLDSAIGLLQTQLGESRAALKKVYDKDIIYAKYRNMIAVASFYEYLCSGRCAGLEGHEGAYNTFETEVRLDRIIVQMDQVIQRLNDIQNTQYAVYNAVQEACRQSERLVRSMHQIAGELHDGHANLSRGLSAIQKNSEIAAYRLERTQKYAEYSANLNYLTLKYGSSGSSLAGAPPRH